MAKLKKNYGESISVLGLNPGASPEEIKEAYRKLAKQYHPDVYQLDGGEKFKEINSAYRFLKKHPEPPVLNETQSHYSNPTNDYERRRRAYHKRQKEKKAQEAIRKAEMFKWLFKKLKPAIYVMLLFNSFLAIDYFLPSVLEEVKITKINTVRSISNYRTVSTSKSRTIYNYKADLNNGMTFRFGKEEIAKIDMKKTFKLKRSLLFKEGEYLESKNGDTKIYNEYGLFRIFGAFIPVSILLLIGYLFFIKNNDARLTIFLVVLIFCIFQLFLVF